MANLTSLITDIQNYTARTSAIITTALGTTFLNAALEKMQNAHEWRGQEVTVPLPYPAGTDGVAFPPDFISEHAVLAENANASNPALALTPIGKTTRREWTQRLVIGDAVDRDEIVPTGATAVYTDPEGVFYYLWGGKIYIVNQPSGQTTFRLDYYRKLPDFVTGTDENFFTDFYADVLRWGGIAEAWRFLFEDDRADKADARFGAILAAAIKNDLTIASSGGPVHRGT